MEWVKLGEIASLITKGTTPTTLGFDFVDEGINFIKIESISEEGSFISNKFNHITSECDNKLSRSRLQKNDLLFSIAGAIGRTAIVTDDILPANTNQALALIRIPEGVINYSYLKYVLQSSVVSDQFENRKQGVAQLNISLKDVANFNIPLPSQAAQQMIVEILGGVEVIISLRKQQLAKLDELVKSRFVEMFGDPVENDMNWQTEVLDSICSTIVDCPHSTPSYTAENTGYMCIRTSIVKKNHILWDQIEYIPEHEYRQRIQRKKPEKGDIVYTREGAILGIAAIIDRDCNVALGQRSMLLSPDTSKCLPHFLSTAMNFDSFLRKALGGISGSASPHINVGDIKAFSIIMPPIELQTQFATFVEQTDKSKLSVQQSIDQLETLKKSLMQKYFG